MSVTRSTNLKGKNQYDDFKAGKKLTYKEAVLAHCFECMGGYQDGKQDCCGNSCPLYQYYPYRGLKEPTGGFKVDV